MDKSLKWYGALHVNGTLHTRRLLSDSDMQMAMESGLTARVYGPVEANSRQLAIKAIKKLHHDAAPIEKAPAVELDAEEKLKLAIMEFAGEVGEDAAIAELGKGLYALLGGAPSRDLGDVTIVNNRHD